jgi:hypothetical protein
MLEKQRRLLFSVKDVMACLVERIDNLNFSQKNIVKNNYSEIESDEVDYIGVCVSEVIEKLRSLTGEA